MEQEQISKRKKTWLFFIMIPTITLIIAFFVFSFFTKTFMFEEALRYAQTSFTYPLEEMVINLQDGSRYLKTEIVLGYEMDEDAKKIANKEVQIRDTIIELLRGKSREDIMPVENTQGLKKEMKNQLNKEFDMEIITDIYITEFLIQ